MSFELCQPKDSLDLYPYRSLEFKGHQRAIKKQLHKKLTVLNGANVNDGYLLVNYYINCNGESGLFSFDGMGLDFTAQAYDKQLVEQLTQALKNLNGWQVPFHDDGTSLDAVYSITFKFTDGQLDRIIL